MIFKIVFFAFLGILIFSSCRKKDNVFIESETRNLDNIFTLNVDGVEVVNKTYASYCPSDTLNLYIVASRPDYLKHPWELPGFEENDFSVRWEETGDFGFYGKVALGESTTGIPGVSLFTFSIDMDFSCADFSWTITNNLLNGTANGELRGRDADNNLVFIPYEVTFTAVVDPDIVCE